VVTTQGGAQEWQTLAALLAAFLARVNGELPQVTLTTVEAVLLAVIGS
jgi:hypothetical protein